VFAAVRNQAKRLARKLLAWFIDLNRRVSERKRKQRKLIAFANGVIILLFSPFLGLAALGDGSRYWALALLVCGGSATLGICAIRWSFKPGP
jgi:hypothetical protein